MLRGAEATARALIGMAVVLGVAAYTSAPAQASLAAIGANGTQSVKSGTWSAVPTTLATAPYSTTALALSFATNGSSAPAAQYFWVVNVGTLPLTAATYSAIVSPNVSTVIEACTGAWTETTGACSGAITTVVASTASPAASSTAPAAVGSKSRLRARITTKITSTTTVTIGVNISRAQTQAATTTTT